MAAAVILVEAFPRRAADGIAETVRLAGGGASVPYYYGGQHWQAGIKGLPTISTELKFDGSELGTGGVPSVTAIEWAPAGSAALAALAAYVWTAAPITIRIGPEGSLPPVAISGKVMEVTADSGVLRIVLADPAADLKKPLLTARFAGTGGLEGPVDWEGTIKRRVWGLVWNQRGDPIDKANCIYCFADPTKPVESIYAVRDKGAAAAALTFLAWQGSAAATFTALQAADAPQGGGVVCPSIACVKWWTTPAGQLTADLKGEVGSGYVETSAEIAQRLVQEVAGPAFAAGAIAAAAAARAGAIGWTANSDTETVADILDDLFGAVSLLWLLDASGQIAIREWAWGASAASVRAIDVSRKAAFRPLATRKIGYQRNELPMARGDLAGIVLAGDLAYADGTPIEDLKPAEAGATAGATAEQLDALERALLRIELSRPSGTFWAYADGTPANLSAASGIVRVMLGDDEVTATAALSATGSDCAGTVNTATNTPVSGQPKGFYRATAMSADNATLMIEATVGEKTVTAVFSVSKVVGGYEIVGSLPTTNLFAGRVVSYDGRLWINREGVADGWAPMVDVTNVGVGANMLAGAIPGANPGRYLYFDNHDGIGYYNGGFGPFLSPSWGTGWPGSAWTLPDNGTVAIYQDNASTGATGFSTIYLSRIIDVSGGITLLYPVEVDKTYEFSIYTGAQGCKVEVFIVWLDAAQAGLGAAVGAIDNDNDVGGGNSLNQYKRLYARGKAPAGAAYARLMMRKHHTKAGATNSWMFGAYPMFGETSPDPTDLLPWNMPGYSIFHAEAIAAGTVVTDKLAASSVTAAKINVTQLSAITAVIGTLRTATTGGRMEISDNVQKVYDTSNVKRMQTGDLSL